MTIPASEGRLLPACEVSEEPIRWLWPGRLALGKLALLEGDLGLGKSLVTLDLCARRSRELAFPDGADVPGPSNSMVLNAEDGGETVRSRLAGMGADLSRVYSMEGEAPHLPSQMGQLEQGLSERTLKRAKKDLGIRSDTRAR